MSRRTQRKQLTVFNLEPFFSRKTLTDDFKLWLSRHPGLTIEEALHRYREEQKIKQCRQGPNCTKQKIHREKKSESIN